MLHPVLTVLSCAAVVPSLLLPGDALVFFFFFYDFEGGIASRGILFCVSSFVLPALGLWDRNCGGSLVPGSLGKGSSRVDVQPNRKVVSEMRTELLAPWVWR